MDILAMPIIRMCKRPSRMSSIAPMRPAGERHACAVQAEAERYLAMGCQVIAVCADMGLLRNAAQAVQKHFMQT